jgi:DNA-binding CsgD family transcriptional regulator
VRTHVRNLMKKLDAQSRAHAVAIAMRESALDL